MASATVTRSTAASARAATTTAVETVRVDAERDSVSGKVVARFSDDVDEDVGAEEGFAGAGEHHAGVVLAHADVVRVGVARVDDGGELVGGGFGGVVGEEEEPARLGHSEAGAARVEDGGGVGAVGHGEVQRATEAVRHPGRAAAARLAAEDAIVFEPDPRRRRERPERARR